MILSDVIAMMVKVADVAMMLVGRLLFPTDLIMMAMCIVTAIMLLVTKDECLLLVMLNYCYSKKSIWCFEFLSTSVKLTRIASSIII